jgi:hypothetical protein
VQRNRSPVGSLLLIDQIRFSVLFGFKFVTNRMESVGYTRKADGVRGSHGARGRGRGSQSSAAQARAAWRPRADLKIVPLWRMDRMVSIRSLC